VTDERGLFERTTLEAFQSSLSWLTIPRKRNASRDASALRLAVWIRAAVMSDAEEMVPTGRRADSL
jgi:hypothetical protein